MTSSFDRAAPPIPNGGGEKRVQEQKEPELSSPGEAVPRPYVPPQVPSWRDPLASGLNVPEAFVGALNSCIDHIAANLLASPKLKSDDAPPFLMSVREILEVLKAKLEADAVSVFAPSPNDPNRLVCTAGIGYSESYQKDKFYFVEERALTSWVYRDEGERWISHTPEQLERLQSEREIDFSGTCRLNIATGRFTNIIAVPVQSDAARLGVLKVENIRNKQSARSDKEFCSGYDAFARVVARIIGLARRQEVCRENWARCQQAIQGCRSPEDLQSALQILARWLSAECASLFLKEERQTGEAVLQFKAGIGYNASYRNHTYDIRSKSLTAFVFNSDVPAKKYTVEELTKERGIPYTGACRSYISSGSFRGVILVPLHTQDERLGVLKVENKIGILKAANGTLQEACFDDFDMSICRAVANDLIVPALLRMAAKDTQVITEGYRLLVRQFQESRRLKKNALRLAIKDVVEFMKRNSPPVTADDCAQYLQISRPHFYRLKREQELTGPARSGSTFPERAS